LGKVAPIKWTKEKEHYIRKAYPDLAVSIDEIVKVLGSSRSSIYDKAEKLGLVRERKTPEWKTPENVAFLRENYNHPNHSITTLGQHCGIGRNQVVAFLKKENLKRTVKAPSGAKEKFFIWRTEANKELITKLYKNPNFTASMIAEKIGGGVTKNAVLGWGRRLGLSKTGKTRTVKANKATKPKTEKSAKFTKPSATKQIKSNLSPLKPETSEICEQTQPPETVFKIAAHLLNYSKRNSCTWIGGEGSPRKPWVYCDEPCIYGKSYCACHCGMVYVTKKVRQLGFAD
jgi:GcrA cell cycle regulator